MKKGFTLIEVLAVIVILGLLIAMVSPVVNNLLGDSEDALSDKQVDSIVKASKKYMVEHSELLPENSDSTAIYISDLIDNGVIDNDEVIDPKTKEEMNGCVVVNYNENFNQYEYNYRDDCSITITFDPEGGSVDTTSKKVMIGKTYGELPTPTRDGYIFKGWRGKNMLDMTAWLNSFSTATRGTISKGDNSITLTATSNDAYTNTYKYGINDNNIYFQISLNPEIQYTISWDSDFDKQGYVYLFINNQQKRDYLFYKAQTQKEITFITPQDAEYMTYRVGVGKAGDSITYSNIQIEEGDTATEYEPYQEFTSDTIVNKGSDYVMHAIWEVAS